MPSEYILQKNEGGMHYIVLDKKTVAALTKSNNKRAICRINDELEIHCAVLHQKEGGHYIVVGGATCRKLKIKEGSKLKATFRPDDTDYQFAMPEELREVLATDEVANKIFHALTAGNQRGLIYLVAQVKSSEKRIERALKIAERLKQGITSQREILK